MNLDKLTYGELKQIAKMFENSGNNKPIDNGMIGKYVVVRCRDAGVHAGFLESYSGRECVLIASRRLWQWVPANNSLWLGGVAQEGLSNGKIGPVTDRIHLTENCEIIQCSEKAEESIRSFCNG